MTSSSGTPVGSRARFTARARTCSRALDSGWRLLRARRDEMTEEERIKRIQEDREATLAAVAMGLLRCVADAQRRCGVRAWSRSEELASKGFTSVGRTKSSRRCSSAAPASEKKIAATRKAEEEKAKQEAKRRARTFPRRRTQRSFGASRRRYAVRFLPRRRFDDWPGRLVEVRRRPSRPFTVVRLKKMRSIR